MIGAVLLVAMFVPTVATSFQLFEKPKAAEIDKVKLARIDGAVKSAIDKGEVPGAVVVIVHGDAVVFRKAYGHRAKKPFEEEMTLDTIFDLASLTKPLATATAIHKLAEAGKLKLTDKVADHWPEFAANGKGDVTIEHCLLHTSGLTPDNALADYKDGKASALKAIAALKLDAPAGTLFKYSDVGFIVLGELVGRLGKMPLDEYAAKHLFAPLGMTDTSFKPSEKRKSRIAPTGLRNKEIIRGEVHDPRAKALGGVAGHAGLFGTADDLALFARMLLRGGERDEMRILESKTVKLMTDGKAVPPKGKRSLGWDVDTGYSAPRGSAFPAGQGFGHTGFTGTSIWIDTPSKTAIIILTNRVHPDDKGNATPLRKAVGTIVAEALPKE